MHLKFFKKKMLNIKNNRYVHAVLKFLYLDIVISQFKFLYYGIVTAWLTFVTVKNFFFTIITTLDELFMYSLINALLFTVILYIYSFITSFDNYEHIRLGGVVFILGFFLCLELVLIIILFDGFTWFNIKIIVGKCPWKYLRPFMACFFLFIFWSSIKFSQRFILKLHNSRPHYNFIRPDVKKINSCDKWRTIYTRTAIIKERVPNYKHSTGRFLKQLLPAYARKKRK